MTFEQWLTQAMRDFKGVTRLGQHLFNKLGEYKYHLLDEVIGVVGLDPFYVDENIPTFLQWLERRW